MSLALGDVNAESLKALVTQGGSELDDFVAKLNVAANNTEDHAEADMAELVNAFLAGVKGIIDPMNANLTALLALLNEVKSQGLDVGGMKIQLQPPKGTITT